MVGLWNEVMMMVMVWCQFYYMIMTSIMILAMIGMNMTTRLFSIYLHNNLFRQTHYDLPGCLISSLAPLSVYEALKTSYTKLKLPFITRCCSNVLQKDRPIEEEWHLNLNIWKRHYMRKTLLGHFLLLLLLPSCFPVQSSQARQSSLRLLEPSQQRSGE